MIFFSFRNFQIFSKNKGVVIVKHANPYGISVLKITYKVIDHTNSPVSAFGE